MKKARISAGLSAYRQIQLSIKNIVVRHDGTIDVDTEQGAGTTFTLIFQIKRQKEGSQ